MALLTQTLTDTASSSTPPGVPGRDPWKDNARLALMALVVFGHCLESIRGMPQLHALYLFIYMFHMPAFAFLSGSVANAQADLKLLRTVTFRLLLPYLLFQCLYALAAHIPGWPDHGPDGVTRPYWLLWYLPSLAAWRLLLPIVARLRHPLVLALVAALAAGWADDIGYGMSLSRTAVLFPLFLLGHLYGAAWRDRLQGLPVRVLAVVALLAMAMATDVVPDAHWLYGSLGYKALHVDDASGPLWRLLQIGTGALGTAAFLALVPRRMLAASEAGGRSLQAYLAHGFLIKIGRGSGFFHWVSAFKLPLLTAFVMLVLAWLVVRLLSSVAAARLLEPLTRPRWLERWLWRGEPAR